MAKPSQNNNVVFLSNDPLTINNFFNLIVTVSSLEIPIIAYYY